MKTYTDNQISATIIADSINPITHSRITSIQVTLPKFVLAEFNTHKIVVKNFSSSRAIPSKLIRKQVLDNPFVPSKWGMNQKGMYAVNYAEGFKASVMRGTWIGLSKIACLAHWFLEKMGLHKQTCNRLIEPWLTATGVATATDWNNFLKLRCAPDAQPEIRTLACLIREALNDSMPKALYPGEVHAPYLTEEDRHLSVYDQVRISAARCCRASYNKLGKLSNKEDDIALFEKLKQSMHFSPMEHIAFCLPEKDYLPISCQNVYFKALPDNLKAMYLQRNFVGLDGISVNKSGWAMLRAVIEPLNGDLEYTCSIAEEFTENYCKENH